MFFHFTGRGGEAAIAGRDVAFKWSGAGAGPEAGEDKPVAVAIRGAKRQRGVRDGRGDAPEGRLRRRLVFGRGRYRRGGEQGGAPGALELRGTRRRVCV